MKFELPMKVKCINASSEALMGEDKTWAAIASDHLKVGSTYLIAGIDQSSYHTKYRIDRQSGWLNSVRFTILN